MSNLLQSQNIPCNKHEQNLLSQNLISTVIEGETDPIQAVVKAKALMEILKGFVDSSQVKEAVILETEKYGKGERPSYGGAEIQIKEVGVKWDYTACNDPVWERLSKELEDAQKKLKERETYLKAITQRKAEIDEETGDIVDIFPPARSSTTSYSVTFKKK